MCFHKAFSQLKGLINNLWLIDWLVSLDVRRINPAVQSSPVQQLWTLDLGPWTDREDRGWDWELLGIKGEFCVGCSKISFVFFTVAPNTIPSRLITLFPPLCSLPFQFRRLLCSALLRRLIRLINRHSFSGFAKDT